MPHDRHIEFVLSRVLTRLAAVSVIFLLSTTVVGIRVHVHETVITRAHVASVAVVAAACASICP